MNIYSTPLRLFVLMAFSGAILVTTGCARRDESAAFGILAGSIAGAIIGHQYGYTTLGSVIGGAAGNFGGLVANTQIVETQASYPDSTGPVHEAYRIYQQTPPPQFMQYQIVRGGGLRFNASYIVSGADEYGTPVTINFVLVGGDQTWTLFSDSMIRRNGSYSEMIDVKIPEYVPLGDYYIHQTIDIQGNHTLKKTAVEVI